MAARQTIKPLEFAWTAGGAVRDRVAFADDLLRWRRASRQKR
jgi:hypothetical protein